MGLDVQFSNLNLRRDDVDEAVESGPGYTIVFGIRKQGAGSGIIDPHAYSDIHRRVLTALDPRVITVAVTRTQMLSTYDCGW